MEVSATIFPAKLVVVPNVAELPTRQKTWRGRAVLISTTLDALAVMRVLPILKRKTAAGLPWASRVSVPVIPAEDGKQYTPGVRVSPPISVIGG
jgi:hypothetical protein